MCLCHFCFPPALPRLRVARVPMPCRKSGDQYVELYPGSHSVGSANALVGTFHSIRQNAYGTTASTHEAAPMASMLFARQTSSQLLVHAAKTRAPVHIEQTPQYQQLLAYKCQQSWDCIRQEKIPACLLVELSQAPSRAYRQTP